MDDGTAQARGIRIRLTPEQSREIERATGARLDELEVQVVEVPLEPLAPDHASPPPTAGTARRDERRSLS